MLPSITKQMDGVNGLTGRECSLTPAGDYTDINQVTQYEAL